MRQDHPAALDHALPPVVVRACHPIGAIGPATSRRFVLNPFAGMLSEMKSISSAIIVAAGLGTITVGSFIRHGDTGLFVVGCGIFATGTGMIGWFKMLASREP